MNHWPTPDLPPAPEFAGDPDPKDWLPIEWAMFHEWAVSLKDYPDKPKRKKQ
jgi:hypothetical protein